MATVEIINKALEVMSNHDWYWMMSDFTHPAIDNARGSMRYFVELVASISNVVPPVPVSPSPDAWLGLVVVSKLSDPMIRYLPSRCGTA